MVVSIFDWEMNRQGPKRRQDPSLLKERIKSQIQLQGLLALGALGVSLRLGGFFETARNP